MELRINLAAACILLCPPVAMAQQAAPYRCLAPFVWSVTGEKTPASLFEYFLSGPFDRIGKDEAGGETFFEAGWRALLFNDNALARRCFRSAWSEDSKGEALLAIALLHIDEPKIAMLLAREAIDKCSGQAWKEMGDSIVSGEISNGETLAAWSLLHPKPEEIGLFVLREELLGRERSSGPDPPVAYDRVIADSLAEREGTEWMRIVHARLSGANFSRQEVRELAKAGPTCLLEATLYLLVKNDITGANDLLVKAVEKKGFPPDLYPLAIELCWRLDQGEKLKSWTAAWLEQPVYSEEEWDEREARIRAFHPEPGDSLIRRPSLEEKVNQITEWMEGGRERDALFAADRDFRAQVAGADRRGEFALRLSGLAEKAKWRKGWEQREKPIVIPNPPDRETSLPNGIVVTLTNGKGIDLSSKSGGGRVVLFYSGIGCPACQAQLQAFAGVWNSLQELDIEVVAVSAQDPVAIGHALTDSGASFPFLFAGDPTLSAFAGLGMIDEFEDYPLHGAVLIDGGGFVRWATRSYAPFTGAEFFAGEAARLLGEK